MPYLTCCVSSRYAVHRPPLTSPKVVAPLGIEHRALLSQGRYAIHYTMELTRLWTERLTSTTGARTDDLPVKLKH